MNNPRYWVGVDTGGTFTDLVLKNVSDNSWSHHKVPTVTADPAQGVLDGIKELLANARVNAADVDYVVLGTTKATNAVLESNWARTGVITTQGFGDVLDIARQRRPHYFNWDIPKPIPPAQRADRYEVTERVAHDGTVIQDLDEQQVINAIEQMRDSGIEAVAVCFMHSYANTAHEERVLELLSEYWPQAYACTSSGVLPEFREYERFITATVNASLLPVMDAYLARFEDGIRAQGVSKRVCVMQSNGGAVTTSTVRKMPINTFFSGPAGGVTAAAEIGRLTGIANLIGFDMGGTSTDVCLIRNGKPMIKHEGNIAGFPVRAPALDIHTIGAGGGSIAWADGGGLLKVGPRSAGAHPGPAAYGRGGTSPTVTDANVFLGRLSPVSLLDGRMAIYPEKAKAALREGLCNTLGYDELQAAVGIIEVASVHMTGAIRVITVEQGEDPRDYALVAFGGAGPLHAVDVAKAAGIRHVIIPSRSGVLSAQGLLQAAPRADFGVTCLVPLQASSISVVNDAFTELSERVRNWAQDENGEPVCEWALEMRYVGQSSDLPIPLDRPQFSEADVAVLCQRFNARHEELFGYQMSTREIEISHVRVTASLPLENHAPASTAAHVEPSESVSEDFRVGDRDVWFPDVGFVKTDIIKRELIPAETRFEGPAIIEQMDTTTVVPPGTTVYADKLGYLHIHIQADTTDEAQA